MAHIYRCLIGLFVAFFLAGTMLPLRNPVKFSVDLAAFPADMLLAGGGFGAAAIASLVACVGLLRFRPWGRNLAVAVAVVWLAGVLLCLDATIVRALSPTAAIFFALSAMTWLASIAMSQHPSITVKFRTADET